MSREIGCSIGADADAAWLSCEVDLRGGGLSCSGAGAALDDGALGAIIGGQGVYVQLASNNVGYNETTEVFSASVSVKNLSDQVIGSADGVTPDPAGVRIFFVEDPTVEGPGSASVANADGKANFSGSDQDYFEYSQALAPGQTSLPRTWEWSVSPTVTKFSFSVGVSAEIPDEAAMASAPNFIAKSVAGDTLHTCALDLDGQAWCWGVGNFGQMGDGMTEELPRPTPQKVQQGDLRFVSLAAGREHTCALDINGDAYCWGNTALGRLGNGTVGDGTELTPVKVVGDHKFIQITAGRRFTCGLTVDHDARCWGAAHAEYSPIGHGTSDHVGEPSLVRGNHKFSFVAAAKYHACGITLDGDAICWGSGSTGKLGSGDTDHQFVPVPVLSDLKFRRIGGGNSHTCAITTEGEAWCWGSGANHKLGVLVEGAALTGTNPEPHRVTTDRRFVDIDGGQYHTCALDLEGKAWCWGSNAGGKIGLGTSSGNISVPSEVVGGHTFVELSVGLNHTCGRTANGDIYCWGRGDGGQLGNGDTEDQNDPNRVLPWGN